MNLIHNFSLIHNFKCVLKISEKVIIFLFTKYRKQFNFQFW